MVSKTFATSTSPLALADLDAAFVEVEALASVDDSVEINALALAIETVEDDVTTLEAQAANALLRTGGVATGAIFMTAAQSLVPSNEFATKATTAQMIAAAIAAIPGTPPDPANAPLVTTIPVITSTGQGLATSFSITTSDAAVFADTPRNGTETKNWRSNGVDISGATGATLTSAGSGITQAMVDAGAVISVAFKSVKAGYPDTYGLSNGIQLLAAPSSAPTVTTPASVAQSPAGTYTLTFPVWSDAAVVQVAEVRIIVSGVETVIKTGPSANVYIAPVADTGKLMKFRIFPTFGGNPIPGIPFIDTTPVTVNGTWTVPNSTPGFYTAPSAASAPDQPGAIAVTPLGGTSYGLTSAGDFDPDCIRHWFWKANQNDPPGSSNYLGTTPSGVTAVIVSIPVSSSWVEVGSENTISGVTTFSARSTPTQLVAPSGAALSFNDSRWIWNPRAKRTFSQLGNTDWPGMWIEGDASGGDTQIQLVSDPLVDPDSVNRISRIADPEAPSEFVWRLRIKDGVTPLRGGTYRAQPVCGFGTQVIPFHVLCRINWAFRPHQMLGSTLEQHFLAMGDFHHFGGPYATGSGSPFAMFLNPSGYAFHLHAASATQTTDMDVVPFYADTSNDTTNMHYFSMLYRASPTSSGYIRLMRRIGRNGTPTLLREYFGQTCYDEVENCLYVKFGLYSGPGAIPGGSSYTVDMKAFQIIREEAGTPTLSETVMFDYMNNMDV